MTDREQILKLLADNAGTISDNLQEFWFRHAEDLEAVGVDPVALANTLMTVAVAHTLKVLGADAAAAELGRLHRATANLAAKLNCAQTARRH